MTPFDRQPLEGRGRCLKVTAAAEIKVVSVGRGGTGWQGGTVPRPAVHHPERTRITGRAERPSVHRVHGSRGKVGGVLRGGGGGGNGSVMSGVSGMAGSIEEHPGVRGVVEHLVVVDHPAGVGEQRFRGHDLVPGFTGEFVNNARMLLLLKSARLLGLVVCGVRRCVLLLLWRGYGGGFVRVGVIVVAAGEVGMRVVTQLTVGKLRAVEMTENVRSFGRIHVSKSEKFCAKSEFQKKSNNINPPLL